MENCKFCDKESEKLLIKNFDNWKIFLHENQYYPGRIQIILGRHGPETTNELSEEEWIELKKISDKLTKTLQNLYKPDLIHYIVLQNENRYHFYMQLVPRYSETRVIHGEEFKDENWGKVPFPTPKKEFSEKLLLKIKEDIQNEL